MVLATDLTVFYCEIRGKSRVQRIQRYKDFGCDGILKICVLSNLRLESWRAVLDGDGAILDPYFFLVLLRELFQMVCKYSCGLDRTRLIPLK